MKKFLSMFAFMAVLVLGAFTLASCGDDDDDAKSTILTGTTWKGVISFGPLKANTTIKFNTDNYDISIVGIDAPLSTTRNGNYSMSSDNKTVYISAEEGQTIGKISDDGKTMTISNSVSEASGTLTKQ